MGVLVTGAAGYIGGYLRARLDALGVDLCPIPLRGLRRAGSRRPAIDATTIRPEDMRASGIDTVIQAATSPAVDRWLAEMAKAGVLRRAIVLSSMLVYQPRKAAQDERARPITPTRAANYPDMRVKILAALERERRARRMARDLERVIVLRLGTVWGREGPGNPWKGFVMGFVRAALDGVKEIVLETDGSGYRSVLSQRALGSAVEGLMESNGPRFDVYNCADSTIRVFDWAETIAKRFGLLVRTGAAPGTSIVLDWSKLVSRLRFWDVRSLDDTRIEELASP